MVVMRYVGKQPIYKGKTLVEICLNLRNFGVGRVVYRHRVSQLFPEKSFVRLTKVQPDMTDKYLESGIFWGEKVHRGVNLGECFIDGCDKTDWNLVRKDEEEEFSKITTVLERKEVLSDHTDCPPLLKVILQNQMKQEGKEIPDDIRINIEPCVYEEPVDPVKNRLLMR